MSRTKLGVTFHFEPSAELEGLKSGSEWCGSPDEAGAFGQMIERSKAFTAVRGIKAAKVVVRYQQC